jgi:ABC-type lipoprotein release transport system permease subunit
MPSMLGDSLGDQRHWAAVIGGFALAALLLSAVGAFGVLAAYVARQQREIGIRLALGADRGQVVRTVLGRGFRWAAAGCAFGVLLALLLTRGLESLLFGVERLDPLNLACACAVLLAIAYAACWLPARRAADVDPMVALRHE